MAERSREADIEAVYGHVADLTRRVTARSRRLSEPLTFVQHSLVRFIAATAGTRATDIAAAFQLNRSTVSRQVNELITLGLVRYLPHDDDEPGRGRVLELTAHGRAQLDRTAADQQRILTHRLSGWTDAQVAALAATLAHFNEGADD
ncbi:MarR family winged helix-turn-helix transcriptional regulator [Specibacter cremeus]|uniref:MarR family winged helix-turn-helix transcriptional regulator n=1 Tax=Specibacter cremeus TaxID=1629051 RepID=UPI000F7A1FAB|nr:MarR family winged helix-turn-helix transcriptional regulator [Specibacter cremeus]